MKPPIRFTILLAISLLAGFLAYSFVPAPLPEISRGEFLDEVRAGHVRKVEIKDQELILSESTRRGPFRTKFDKTGDARLADELRGLGVEVWYSRSAMGI